MNRYFDSHECCKLIDDIEDYKQGKNNDLKSITERVILMQKEEIRINKELGNEVDETIDTIEDIKNYIENDTHNFTNYIESKGIDFFDYERFEEVV